MITHRVTDQPMTSSCPQVLAEQLGPGAAVVSSRTDGWAASSADSSGGAPGPAARFVPCASRGSSRFSAARIPSRPATAGEPTSRRPTQAVPAHARRRLNRICQGNGLAPARRADLSVVTPSARGHRSCSRWRSALDLAEARTPAETGRPS